MIYTVTFNPAVDLVMRTDGLKGGEVNRARSEELMFGGKGINVSLVLRELGVESVALGFVAGFTGEAIEQGVRSAGVKTDFIRLESGFSRINVKIKAESETELNGTGPDIPDSALEELLARLDGLCEGDTLVLAGSVPPSMPADIYERILARLSGRGIRAAVDAQGELLRDVLKYRPYLIKPNDRELGELFGVEINGAAQAREYAARLQAQGARNVLVSMAEKGAVLLDEGGGEHFCAACTGQVRNSVGAGDSMLAGFLAGAQRGFDEALRLGTAAGGATAFSDCLAVREDIERLLQQI